MTETSADRMHALGDGAGAPAATEERGERRPPDDSGDGTPIGLDDGGAHDAAVDGWSDRLRAVEPAGPAGHAAGGPVLVSWRHALLAGLACFAVWLLFDASSLLHSAQSAPLGARRSVAITILRPVADVSEALGLSHIVGGVDRVIGHTAKAGSGVLQVEGLPLHPHRVAPRRPVRRFPPLLARQPTAPAPVTAPDGLAPLAVPTASAPLRLLVVGDSLGIDFGQPLVNDLASTDVVSAVLDGHIDTGLARPDYFDWQSELQADLARYQPQVVVVLIGANDPQNFVDGSTAVTYGTAAWNAAYAKRVGTFMEEAAASGARVAWIGMPPMADPVLNAKMQTVNGVDEDQAAMHRGVSYFASWPVLSDPQGHYATFLPDASGSEVQVREPDGTHIATSGAQRLSQAVIGFMGHQWGLVL